jgi:uncharacterized membrane protein YhaH (DUF805 family)
VSDTWYYSDRSERIGPVSAEALRATLARSPNAAGVYVWRAGFTDWKRAGDVPELWTGAPPPAPFPQGGAVAGGYAQQAGIGAYGQASVGSYEQPNLVQLWFSFTGRANRAKYWLVGLVNVAIVLVFSGIAYAIGTIGYVILALIYIGQLVSGISMLIRRLHDRDKSGWWALIFIGLLVAAGIIGAILNLAIGTAGSAIGGLLYLGVAIWMFVELGCLRGTIGDNRFGPDPLGGQQ